MNKKFGILATAFLSLALLMASVHEAEARRMGGGRSFGSKPGQSESYQRSATPAPASQSTRSASQQQAAAQNQTARQSWANRGGLMGMLGGLALGGLLGSLFFGGAFEGINFMDILLFAGIAFLAYRLLSARARNQSQPVTPGAYGRQDTTNRPETVQYRDNDPVPANRSFNTDVLFGKGGSPAPMTDVAASIPAGFDQATFLAGAENAFRHLQAAWDKRDLATIRGLTTDKVFAELQGQLQASDAANKTEVLKVSAELLEVREVGSELEATVLFDCIMREDDGDSGQVREVWHFTKAVKSTQAKWFLDGIQQLED
ncbi:MAG: Tim44 domain-containing protein [Methylomonas sp.]|nr:Tim44 domain-containing protein [Methylomonas sp.]PPD19508.1 MAG: transporter [Methylomonas sp.]PPD38391.1 MAG: transporter [Methylomonas sp.]PPD53799.1 MAG: transporter [Methylomonas sp.]